MTSASGFKAKALCFKQFAICLKNKGPSSDVAMDVSYDGEPDRHPYVVSTPQWKYNTAFSTKLKIFKAGPKFQ